MILQENNFWIKIKKHCQHPLWRWRRCFFDFRGKDVKPARSVLYPRNGNDGGIQRGQRPFLAHGLCLQSLVCYTLYLRVCEKSGTGFGVSILKQTKRALFLCPCHHRSKALWLAGRGYSWTMHHFWRVIQHKERTKENICWNLLNFLRDCDIIKAQ